MNRIIRALYVTECSKSGICKISDFIYRLNNGQIRGYSEILALIIRYRVL